jgi:hypothetical protein
MDSDPVVKSILIAIMFVLLGGGAALLTLGVQGIIRKSIRTTPPPTPKEEPSEVPVDDHRRAA